VNIQIEPDVTADVNTNASFLALQEIASNRDGIFVGDSEGSLTVYELKEAGIYPLKTWNFDHIVSDVITFPKHNSNPFLDVSVEENSKEEEEDSPTQVINNLAELKLLGSFEKK